MSDVLRGQPSGPGGNGRAQNGGTRAAGGPVPVGQDPAARIRTPTEVMRARRDRDARKKAEQEQREADEEELRRIQQQQQREEAAGVAGESPIQQRRSTGRRAEAETSYLQQDDSRRADRGSSGSRVNPALQPAAPVGSSARRPEVPSSGGIDRDTTQQQSSARPRPNAVDQGQPRPVTSQQPRTTSASHAQAGPSNPPRMRADPPEPLNLPQPQPQPQPPLPQHQNGARTYGDVPQSQSQAQQQQNRRSGFPHAFERWETLSSHWEGLTSYWIRKLQENSNDMSRDPLNQQMSRQITDLSAAGANLFHAVVELQRLRASSERKFQRWFFETRAEQERFQEVQGEMEGLLRVERQGRADAVERVTKAESDKLKAEELVKEMRRELQISKDEARRAWEELGRREQDERDKQTALRNGEPTLVGGVQVVPMTQGVPSRQTSTRDRPPTRESPYAGVPGSSNMAGQQRYEQPVESPEREGIPYTAYDPQTSSPTETDPFTETGREGTTRPLHHEPDDSALGRPGGSYTQPPTSSAAMSTYQSHQPSASTAAPATRQDPFDPRRQHLQEGEGRFYQHEGSAIHPTTAAGVPSEGDTRSYIPSTRSGGGSELAEEEYEIGPDGQYRRDNHGRRIPFQRGAPSEESDDYDADDTLQREREYEARYGGVEYGSGNTATTEPRPQQQQQQQSQGQGGPDYSGSSWGGQGAGTWEGVTPRHRHPTRLSDVLEEDERSRTSPSRASQESRASRGLR